jgi:hypothetical protein
VRCSLIRHDDGYMPTKIGLSWSRRMIYEIQHIATAL